MVKRRHLGGVILSLLLANALAAEPPTTAVIGTPPQPGWNSLSTQQKIILGPLAGEWDKMENIRRKKWVGIADRYPVLTPDEQRRMKDRMREWANLTPEQRAKARDGYKEFNQLPAEQKQVVMQKWEAYSNLPPEERQRVRQAGKSSQLLAPPAEPLPASAEAALPSTQASANSDGKPVADEPGKNQ